MKFLIIIEVDENSTWPNGNKTLLHDLNRYKEKGLNDSIESAVWDAVNAGNCVKVISVREDIK